MVSGKATFKLRLGEQGGASYTKGKERMWEEEQQGQRSLRWENALHIYELKGGQDSSSKWLRNVERPGR